MTMWNSCVDWLSFDDIETLYDNRELFQLTAVNHLPVEVTGIFMVIQPGNGLVDNNQYDMLSGDRY